MVTPEKEMFMLCNMEKIWVPVRILIHDFTDNGHNGETIDELVHLLVYMWHMSCIVVGAAVSEVLCALNNERW